MPGLLQGSEEDGDHWANSLISVSGAGHSDRNVAARAKATPAPPRKGKHPPCQEHWAGEGGQRAVTEHLLRAGPAHFPFMPSSRQACEGSISIPGFQMTKPEPRELQSLK